MVIQLFICADGRGFGDHKYALIPYELQQFWEHDMSLVMNAKDRPVSSVHIANMHLQLACWPMIGGSTGSGVCTVNSRLLGACRWACLNGQDYPEEDTAVHKMVMNIGRNPTVNPADAETTVEIHVLHKFTKDFYGQGMSAVACGFIRYVSIWIYVCRFSKNNLTSSMY